MFGLALKKILLPILTAGTAMVLCCCGNNPEGPDDAPVTPPIDSTAFYYDDGTSQPSSWVALSPLGSVIDPEKSTFYKNVEKRGEKYVGIFYFTWHGCHGYDNYANSNDVIPPSASDVLSPYDITELLKENPDNPQYGPPGAAHHWGRPYLDYYVAGDPWVIRKHAQMLSDAGVDVLLLDVTNGYTYLSVVKVICETMLQMRAEGCRTPQIAFVLNAAVPAVFNTLYDNIYSKGLYRELWFEWLGKPLMLANIAEIPTEHVREFTFRQSWFLYSAERTSANSWFGNGEDKWAWGSWFPQQVGTHNGANECICVMPATHPTSNLGRSYDGVRNVQPSQPASGDGIFFKTEFDYAMKIDPQFIFITGWNEWAAQRQTVAEGQNITFMGKPLSVGDPFFVDQYNHEFSRDIEPLDGDFGDNYYYMMVDYIRRYKGVKQTPRYGEGDIATYRDDKGDTAHRSHFGWGRVGTLTNDSGRNDIVLCQVVKKDGALTLSATCASSLTSPEDAAWMRLFIHTSDKQAGWEGFQFRVIPGTSGAVLEKSTGGWTWEKAADLACSISGKTVEVSIPLSAIGISGDEFTIDFKWIDNAAADGDIQTCMRDGDSAPNGRFRYRFAYKKQ